MDESIFLGNLTQRLLFVFKHTHRQVQLQIVYKGIVKENDKKVGVSMVRYG